MFNNYSKYVHREISGWQYVTWCNGLSPLPAAFPPSAAVDGGAAPETVVTASPPSCAAKNREETLVKV